MTDEDQKTGFIQKLKDLPGWLLYGLGPMLPILYVLSIGPVFWFLMRFNINGSFLGTVYWPLIYWHEHKFIGYGLIEDYVRWWWNYP